MLKDKEADMTHPRRSEIQLYPIKWEGTIDRTQFLARADKSKTCAVLAFKKEAKCREIAGETELWREMSFVTSDEVYQDDPPNRE